MIATTILGIAIGLLILSLVRFDRMHGAYAVWWVLVALSIILLGLFPGWVDWLGRELGIFYPPILILVVAVCLLYVKVLTMDMERSRHERLIRRLAQRLAVMEQLYKEREESGRE